MAPRTLPGLGLSGFWALGEDGWKDANDVNLRTLSALTQPVVLSRTTALPGSPTDGDIYIVPDGAGSNPNEIAIRDNGSWVYLVPEEGWTAYVIDSAENVQFDGADWIDFAASGGGVEALDDLSDVNAPTPTDGQVLTWDESAGEWVPATPTGGGGGGGEVSGTIEWSMTVAASDETTDLTVGDSKIVFFMPVDITLTQVFSTVSGQSSSGDVTIDVRKNGTTIFATPPSINASEDTSLTGTVAVLSTTSFVQGDKIEIDVDAAGTGASGLKISFIGTMEGGGAAFLSDLLDVDAATPSSGEVLTWDASVSPGEWVAAPPSIPALDDLTDVNAPTPDDGFVLTWDDTEGAWIAAPAVPAIEFDLDDVQDVIAPSPTDGQVLTWDASSSPPAWVAASIPYDIPLSFSGTPDGGALIGKLIVVRDITFAANFSGSVGHVGTNPDATFAIDVQDDGVSIGTISISTGGVFTFTTSGGTAKTVASGSRIEFYAPTNSPAEETIADIAATLLGAA